MALNNDGIACGDTTLIRPRGIHKATIVWLHDIGENGRDSARFVRELKLPNIKWICPTAPTRPISRLGGAVTTAWFDDTHNSDDMNNLQSINTASAFVANLLADEPDVMKGVGGIGVGAAEALYIASGYVTGGMNNMSLNFIVAINGWLPAMSNFQHHIYSGTVVPNLAASLPILLTLENSNNMAPHGFEALYQTLVTAGIPITPTNWNPTFVRNWLKQYLQL